MDDIDKEPLEQIQGPSRVLDAASLSGLWVMALGGCLVAVAMMGYFFQ